MDALTRQGRKEDHVEGKKKRVGFRIVAEKGDPKKVEEAINQRGKADYDCFMVLRDLMADYGPEVHSAIERSGKEWDQDARKNGIMNRIKKALEDRDNANEKFLREVSGRS